MSAGDVTRSASHTMSFPCINLDLWVGFSVSLNGIEFKYTVLFLTGQKKTNILAKYSNNHKPGLNSVSVIQQYP